MRQIVEKVVDGRHYQFQQFTATVALKTLSQLTQVLGEPLTLVFGAFKKASPGGAVKSLLKADTKDADTDLLAKAVKSLIGQLSGAGTDNVLALVKSLTSGDGVLCDNVKVASFDLHYAGYDGLMHLPKVLTAALEAQYGNFLTAVSERLPEAAAKPAAAMGGPIGIR